MQHRLYQALFTKFHGLMITKYVVLQYYISFIQSSHVTEIARMKQYSEQGNQENMINPKLPPGGI